MKSLISQMISTKKELFDWLVDHAAGRVEWRFSSLESGEPSLPIMLIIMKLTSLATSLDMMFDVSYSIVHS